MEKQFGACAQTFLVFQGTAFEEECRCGLIWAPRATRRGRRFPDWERLWDVRAGDVFVHVSTRGIRAVSRAAGASDACRRSACGFREPQAERWDAAGRRVVCDYTRLRHPLRYDQYREELALHCGGASRPFDAADRDCPGYLYALPQAPAAFLARKIAARNPKVLELEYLRFLLPVLEQA